eukprot:scaffold43953_cov61-Phaeocystis_antarctica.AAC.1
MLAFAVPSARALAAVRLTGLEPWTNRLEPRTNKSVTHTFGHCLELIRLITNKTSGFKAAARHRLISSGFKALTLTLELIRLITSVTASYRPRGTARLWRSMDKVPLWQRLSSALAPPRGAPGGSGRLDTLPRRA